MATGFFYRNWAEVGFLALLIIGFLLSLRSTSAIVGYVLIFIAGIMSGRLVFGRRKRLAFPVYLMLIGFLIGFIVGAPFGDKGTMFVLYIIGGILGHQFFKKGILRDIKIHS